MRPRSPSIFMSWTNDQLLAAADLVTQADAVDLDPVHYPERIEGGRYSCLISTLRNLTVPRPHCSPIGPLANSPWRRCTVGLPLSLVISGPMAVIS